MSAVTRTGQRFGMSYLIDFLRGSQAKAIRDEHKNLKTYGVGADISKDNWFEYFKDLIAQGFLKQAEGQYPVIVLTEKSEEVLKGNVPVELIKVKVREDKKASLVPKVSLPYIQELFDGLRKLRSAFAKRENVPPYVVFSDATLVEMATYLPQNNWELRKISGIGDLKFEKYGVQFLREIKDHCLKNSLVSRIDLKETKRERKPRTKRDVGGKDTYHISLDMFRNGKPINLIAQERGLGVSTVEGHLARFVKTGEIALDQLVSVDKVEPIREAITKFADSNALSPIKEFLGEDYSYGEIRAVMAAVSGGTKMNRTPSANLNVTRSMFRPGNRNNESHRKP
jgi:ATP-dependent DNA helicase RecQ